MPWCRSGRRRQASTLIVTGVPWRTGWRYAERGWRHLYWDAGTALSQLIAAADSVGARPRLRTRFADAAIARLVGADGVHEFPLALLTLGDGTPATEASGPATSGSLPEVEFPLCTQAQRAGDSDERGPAVAGRPPASGRRPRIARAGRGDPAARLAAADGPQRRAAAPAAGLADARGDARRSRCRTGWWCTGWRAPRPGIYRWPDLDTPQRQAELRDELLRICLDQYLAADAGYVVIGAIDGAELDDRGYRDAQLAAGLVEGRLHLAAYALGRDRVRHDVRRQRGAGPARPVRGPGDVAVHLCRGRGVRVPARRAAGRAGPGSPGQGRIKE